MKIYAALRESLNCQDLSRTIQHLDALGVAGVLLGDHLFLQQDRRPLAEARRSPEPTTMLAAIGALSERLEIGTLVSNVSLVHPIFVIRQFAQLAALFGGERVLMGLGAGWNAAEFDAIGVTMPHFRRRMDRLKETAQLARELFATGIASCAG